jgi:hypothetical protein
LLIFKQLLLNFEFTYHHPVTAVIAELRAPEARGIAGQGAKRADIKTPFISEYTQFGGCDIPNS